MMQTLIQTGLAQLGQAGRVPEHAAALLARYGELLVEKNRVMNLTAITQPRDVATLHMLDCAALLNCAGFEGKTLIDVGTGAGFPGVPLAALVPSLTVTLLDALNKRVDWLGETCKALGLGLLRLRQLGGVLFRLPHQHTHLLGQLVPLGAQVVGLSHGVPVPAVQLDDLVHQGELALLELLFDVFLDDLRVVPEELDV